MYFSHTGIGGQLPRSLENLVDLEVFLVRGNRLEGPLIDFSKLKRLKNVWFDTQAGGKLTGTLAGLATLKNLTFLQASNNAGLSGDLPAELCKIECDAHGDPGITCQTDLPQGCCNRGVFCGKAPKARKPNPSSMGECFPQ